MKMYGTARLGSNMEIRHLPNGDPVGQVSLAFKLSKKDKATGDYMTQWVSASMFGKRAESLAPYLTKGSLHAFHLRDVHIDEFTGKDGTVKTSLRATIEDVELCGNKDSGAQNSNQAPQAASRAAMNAQAPAGGGSGFDDMDSDLPFATASLARDVIWKKLRGVSDDF